MLSSVQGGFWLANYLCKCTQSGQRGLWLAEYFPTEVPFLECVKLKLLN